MYLDSTTCTFATIKKRKKLLLFSLLDFLLFFPFWLTTTLSHQLAVYSANEIRTFVLNDLAPRHSLFVVLIHYFVKIFFLITYLFLFSFTWNGPKFFEVRNYDSESLSKVDSNSACIFARYLKREQKREWANFF